MKWSRLPAAIRAAHRRRPPPRQSIADVAADPGFPALCAANRVRPTRKQARKFVRRQGVWSRTSPHRFGGARPPAIG